MTAHELRLGRHDSHHLRCAPKAEAADATDADKQSSVHHQVWRASQPRLAVGRIASAGKKFFGLQKGRTMPIKVFAVPGDHRDDFANVEQQVNEWCEKSQRKVVAMHCSVNEMPEKKRDIGAFMLTVIVHYE